jgi:hypothetical protein
MLHLLLYLVFHSAAEAVVLIVPPVHALTDEPQRGRVGWLHSSSVLLWKRQSLMVLYLHEALNRRVRAGEMRSEAQVSAAPTVFGLLKRAISSSSAVLSTRVLRSGTAQALGTEEM